MNTRTKILTASLICLSLTGLTAGCTMQASEHLEQGITKSDVVRLTSAPKIAGFFLPGDLMSRVYLKTTPQHLIGEITFIDAPRESTIFSGDSVEWVPITVRIENADPKIDVTELMLRLFPSTDEQNKLENLRVGQRILVMASLPTVDDNNLFGASLGSIFRIGDNDVVYQLDKDATEEGNLSDVLGILNLN